jgi:hypothetical protein
MRDDHQRARPRWLQALLLLLLAPPIALVLLIAGMFVRFKVTYLREIVTTGTAYGFDIGASKQVTLLSASLLQAKYPNAVVYVTTGPRAGDRFEAPASLESLARLSPHDRWVVLLDGSGQYWNVVRLTFEDGTLVEIYRHRQAFELP